MKGLWVNMRGSSIVEAAIVFPFIILVVLVIITITIWFYEEEVSIAAMHINLWDQAQKESLTGQDKNDFASSGPRDSFGGSAFHQEKDSGRNIGLPFMKIKAFSDTCHDRNGFFPYSAKMEFQSQIYIINEMDYIRCYDSMIRGE